MPHFMLRHSAHTQTLCYLGGGHLLVGRSHEDNYPTNITDRPILTGQRTSFTTAAEVDLQVSASLSSGESLYTLNSELLSTLEPSVILTQDVCAVCAIDLPTVHRIASKMDPQPHVVSLNPDKLYDVLDDVVLVGEAVGMKDEAKEARKSLEARIDAVKEFVEYVPGDMRPLNVAFVEWPDPIYVGGHWTPELIKLAGGTTPLHPAAEGGGSGASFPVTPEAVIQSDPDLIIVCPCGLDLAATRKEVDNMSKHEWWSSLRAVQEGKVVLVDGDAMFNRPGPRLVEALEWLAVLMHGLPWQEDFPAEWIDGSRDETKIF